MSFADYSGPARSWDDGAYEELRDLIRAQVPDELASPTDADDEAGPASPEEMHSPMEPPQELLAQLAAAHGCDFGDPPWDMRLESSPHYGPPGTCKNHTVVEGVFMCPSVNPYEYYARKRQELGWPYRYEPGAPSTRRSSPSADFRIPSELSRVMKKKSRSRKKNVHKKGKAPTRKTGLGDMSGLLAALEDASQGSRGASAARSMASMDEDTLADLLGQLRVSRREKQKKKPVALSKGTKGKGTKSKGTKSKGKKKGGAKTRRR